VDDDQDSAELAAVVAQQAGYLAAVVVPVDAADAIPEAVAFAPDVALLDLGLPGMDGFALLAAMRERPELISCRFIAITGYSGRDIRERALAAGFERVLVKPVAFDTLRDAITGATERGVHRA
jgi:CheY-like chemotaxis protein